jgi:hypothetical protein
LTGSGRMASGWISPSRPTWNVKSIYPQIYNTSLLDKYLQSQLLCLLTHLLLCLTTCFGPTGHHQVNHKQTFSTYLQEDFFPQRIRCL